MNRKTRQGMLLLETIPCPGCCTRLMRFQSQMLFWIRILCRQLSQTCSPAGILPLLPMTRMRRLLCSRFQVQILPPSWILSCCLSLHACSLKSMYAALSACACLPRLSHASSPSVLSVVHLIFPLQEERVGRATRKRKKGATSMQTKFT